MGETEEQDDQLNQEQPVSRKEMLAELLAELDAMNISMELAATSISYSGGTLRNKKLSDDPSQKVIDFLKKYIEFEKQIRAYFKKLKKGDIEGLRDDFIVNDSKEEYNVERQGEILTLIKEIDANLKAYIEHGVAQEVNGDEALKKEKLAQIQKAALRHQLNPKQPKSLKPTYYLRGKKKKSSDKSDPSKGPTTNPLLPDETTDTPPPDEQPS